MATLSESNYSLVLDYPVSQEQDSTILQQPNPNPNLQREASSWHPFSSLTLYQRNYSSEDERKTASQGQLDPADPKNFEVDMYESQFQLEMFLRCFFISFFYASGIGMLISALLRPLHSKFYKNYFLYTNSSLLWIVGIINLFAIPASIISIIDSQDQSRTETISGLMSLVYMMTLVSITSASVEACCHGKVVKILKMVKLNSQSLSSTRFRIDYLWNSSMSARLKSLEKQRREEGVSKEQIKKEKEKLMEEYRESEMTGAIQTTISRLNIDISLYYFSFFEKTPGNLLRKLKQKQDLLVTEKGNFLIYDEIFPEENILNAITHFESEIFDYKYCTEPNQYDDKKACAYTLALDLLRKTKPKGSGPFILIGVLYASFIALQAVQYIFDVLGDSQVADDMKVFIILMFPLGSFMQTVPYINIMLVIFQGVKLLRLKDYHMNEFQKLISPKEKPGDYPTLNILDPRSLEAWSCLRKIFMHLYEEKLQGIILALTLVMIIELLEIVRQLLTSFLNRKPIANELFAGSGGSITLFYLAAFLIFAYYAARVNQQFISHCHLILANKQIATSIFNYYPDLIGKNPLKTGTYIRNEGLKFLKREYGESLEGEVLKKMKKDYKKLIETYDNVLEELKHEEIQNPIKILGVPITSTLVKSLGTVLVSAATPILKQVFTSLFNSK